MKIHNFFKGMLSAKFQIFQNFRVNVLCETPKLFITWETVTDNGNRYTILTKNKYHLYSQIESLKVPLHRTKFVQQPDT